MKITVFTPIHRLDSQSLNELYESLKNQTYKNFEWLILLNGPILYDAAALDSLNKMVASSEFTVRILTTYTQNNIGALKAECCEKATGDILVEVDYDDILTPDALEEIAKAFENEAVQFVYSNSWDFLPDGSTSTPFGAQYGWRTKSYQGNNTQMVAFPALPQYLRRIEWAPNHVRSFRKSGYEAVGGYDKSIAVGDDHELICRFYREFGQRGFYHINEVLYHYRIHPENTSNGRNRNAEIQKQVDVNYQLHAEAMFKKWATDEGLLCLDLGGRFNCPDGYASVDLLDANYVVDLTKPWPFADDSVGVLRAYHLLEHLPDTIHFFNEAYRVLAPGGVLLIEVPSTNGKGAFSDPTHIRFFNDLSFEYFTNQQYARFIQPQFKGKFQKSRVLEYNWNTNFGPVPIVSAQLLCLKGWYEKQWCGLKEM